MGEYDRKQQKQESRAVANLRTDDCSKKPKISIIDRRSGMTQLKPAHEDPAKYTGCFDTMGSTTTANLLDISGLGNIYKKTLPDSDTRVKALTEISGQAAQVGNKTAKGGYEDPPVTSIDRIAPFLYDITASHKEEKGSDEKRELTIRYQMANQRNGYILQINDGGREGHIRKLSEARNSPNVFNIDHADTEGDVISSLLTDAKNAAADSTTRKHGNKSWDAYTKLAGEGARFECVKGNIGSIKDNTKIGTIGTGENGKINPYVTFSTLWKLWGKFFSGEFGINNVTVADKLKSNELENIVSESGSTETFGPPNICV